MIFLNTFFNFNLFIGTLVNLKTITRVFEKLLRIRLRI